MSYLPAPNTVQLFDPGEPGMDIDELAPLDGDAVAEFMKDLVMIK